MSGRVVRGFCAAALVAAGLAPGAAQAGHLPAIAGETVVTVDRAAKMRISIPRRALVAIDTSKSVDIAGGGRLTGLVLRENHAQGDVASFIRVPAQLGSDIYASGPHAPVKCDTTFPGYTDCSKAKMPTHYDLHRGTYTLYAFSEGNVPATITLRFANFGGSVTLNPGTPVGSKSVPLATSFGAPVAWSAGAAVEPTSAADLFTVAWWKTDQSAYAEAGACWYDGSDGIEAAGQYRWVPGCPAGSSISMSEVSTPLYGPIFVAKAGQHGLLGTSSTAEPGTFGLGAWTKAQGVRDTGGFAYWLGR
ncbi:MAG TPA: hypothetical protein VNQ77_06795 [Frankiaceae bacterium]|nr:hypothetical protein [Frankiaceae bacterium]